MKRLKSYELRPYVTIKIEVTAPLIEVEAYNEVKAARIAEKRTKDKYKLLLDIFDDVEIECDVTGVE